MTYDIHQLAKRRRRETELENDGRKGIRDAETTDTVRDPVCSECVSRWIGEEHFQGLEIPISGLA